jgi:hypothetical protein
MSGLLDDFLYRTSLLTIVRGKCGYWERQLRHESVRLVGGQWLGEDTYSYECPFAPPDVCPVCEGTGKLDPSDRYDGAEDSWEPRPCIPCGGTGYVPGPHWPYRFPKPPPLRVQKT